MPCNEFGRSWDVGTILFLTGRLNILLEMDITDEQARLIMSQLYGLSKGKMGEPDLKTDPDDPDPFANPDNKVKEWITRDKNGKIVQYNRKVESGPNRGLHWFCNVQQNRTGWTGATRQYGGKEVRGTNQENPKQVWNPKNKDV